MAGQPGQAVCWLRTVRAWVRLQRMPTPRAKALLPVPDAGACWAGSAHPILCRYRGANISLIMRIFLKLQFQGYANKCKDAWTQATDQGYLAAYGHLPAACVTAAAASAGTYPVLLKVPSHGHKPGLGRAFRSQKFNSNIGCFLLKGSPLAK